jgi:hypothetical protein
MMRIMTLILTFLYALGMAAPDSGLAAESDRVAIVPPTEKQYWAGERIDFAIELLAIGQFSGTPQFDLPKLPGVILMKMSQRPLLSTREMDGTSYTVQRHEFALFTQSAGTYTVPPFSVRFGSKEQFDKPEIQHRLTTEPLKIAVVIPERAPPGSTIVSTAELTAEEQWKPKPDKAKVGDAFTRTISIKASDVPGMLLPALPHPEIAGLNVYPKQPKVRDSTERGDLIGERIESVTYVCSKPGDYDIPELVIRWWDVKQKTWKAKTFPRVVLKVSPNPALSARSGSEKEPVSSTSAEANWFGLLVVVALLLAGLLLALPWLTKTVRARRKRWLQSEAGLFYRLIQACREGDAPAADRAMTYWLQARDIPRGQFDRVVSQDEGLTSELTRLQEALIGRDLPWNGRELADRLRHVREEERKAWSRSGACRPLPPLNP